MAPYGASEVAQSTARSKARFEAERFRKGFRRKNKHGRKCSRRKQKHARKCFRMKKKHARKCFRRKKKHARAVISSAQWRRRKNKHARALISIAQTVEFPVFRALRRSKKQARAWFRAPSSYGARLRNDFERIMRKHCACAVFSNAAQQFEVLPVSTQATNLIFNISRGLRPSPPPRLGTRGRSLQVIWD
jgi:hypothetical protein